MKVYLLIGYTQLPLLCVFYKTVLPISIAVMAACTGLLSPFSNASTSGQHDAHLHFFSIDRGLMSETLKAASFVAEVEILFEEQVVEDLYSNSIEGTYTAFEALSLMVADTPCEVIRVSNDYSDVSFAIVRSTSPLKPSSTSSVSSENEKRTNRNLFGNFLDRLVGNSMARNQFSNGDNVDKSVFLLTPFVIDASEDAGYTAQSTLAGTRIRTEVREIASSITILTEQFLEDTGATDVFSLLTYTANTEVGGALGNYSAGGGEGSRFNTQNQRRQPQNGQRIRGLTRAELTRDFFRTPIPFDQYNTSRVTINRGPNSVLFGVGVPGGVIDHSLKQAILARDFNRIDFRFNNRGSHRSSFDFNRVILNERLSVRVAGLYDDTQFQQEPAFERDQRLYTAFKAILFENKNNKFLGKMMLRGHFEFGDIEANLPDVIPPADSFRYWFNGYGPLVDSLLNVPGITIDTLTSNSLIPSDIPAGSDKAANFVPFASINTITREGFGTTATRIPFFIQIPLTYESGSQVDPGYADTSFAGLSGIMGRNRFRGASGRQRQDHYFTGNRIQPLPGFTSLVIQNRDIFDYHNRLLQGDSNLTTNQFNVQQFTLDQSFLDGSAGIEFNYNRQSIDRLFRTPLNAGTNKEIYLDISETASNDLPNPNFLRPAVRSGILNTDRNRFEQETLRLTAFAQFDFNKASEKLGKWLGRHSLTALFESLVSDIDNRTTTLIWDSDSIDVSSNAIFNGQGDNFRRNVNTLTYIGPSVAGMTDFNDVRITDVVNFTYPEVGSRHNVIYWDNTQQQRLEDEFFINENLRNANVERTELNSEAWALKSNFLDEHVVTILAWRRDDETEFGDRLNGGFENDRLPDGNIDPANLILQNNPNSEEGDETFTTSIVAFFPEKYLFDLPLGADLSFHYYEAESFLPSGLRQSIIGTPIDPPVGESTEYGFTLELLERRLSLRVNIYETQNTNNSTGAGGSLNGVTNWIVNWLNRWQEAKDVGIPFSDTDGPLIGLNSYEEMFRLIEGLLPEPTRSLRNISIDESGIVDQTNIEGLASTFDFISDGMEIELVGSIMPNWSIALNVAKQETVRLNTAPLLRDVAFQLEQNIIDAGLDNVRDSPSLGEQTNFLGRIQGDGGLSSLRGELAQDGSLSQEQRKWRANLVTNYTFSEGPLEGFGMGGALRWQDKAAIGYPFLLDEQGNQIPDIDNPFLGEDTFNGDLWFSYRRQIFENRIDWRIQLNIRNAIRDDEDIPVAVNPDGTLAVIRTPPEQSLFITNTFRF